MQASIQKAIATILDRYSKNHSSDAFIHPALAEEMTQAAALVFDVSMNAQLLNKERK